jgi:hypothetical protein
MGCLVQLSFFFILAMRPTRPFPRDQPLRRIWSVGSCTGRYLDVSSASSMLQSGSFHGQSVYIDSISAEVLIHSLHV